MEVEEPEGTQALGLRLASSDLTEEWPSVQMINKMG